MPPSHSSKGSCTGCGDTEPPSSVPAGPSWVTVSPAHSRRSTGRAVVHHRPAGRPGRPRPPRARPRGRCRHEGQQEAPAGQGVERGHLLGQAHQVAPGSSMVVPILRAGCGPPPRPGPPGGRARARSGSRASTASRSPGEPRRRPGCPKVRRHRARRPR